MKNKYLVLLSLIIVLVSSLYIFKNRKNPNTNYKKPGILEAKQNNNTFINQNKNKKKTKNLDFAGDTSAKIPLYEFNSKQVYEWVQSYPKSKQKLIEVATSEDPYVSQNIRVEPHTTDEIHQEKFGAMRVMALQALFDFEEDPKVRVKNLNQVFKNAKDPVIKRIAKSMIESHKKGRNYVEDFLEAAGK